MPDKPTTCSGYRAKSEQLEQVRAACLYLGLEAFPTQRPLCGLLDVHIV